MSAAVRRTAGITGLQWPPCHRITSCFCDVYVITLSSPRLATANLIRPGIHPGVRAKLRRKEMTRKMKFERGGCNADRFGETHIK